MSISDNERIDFLYAELAAVKFFVGSLLAAEAKNNASVETVLELIAAGNVPERYAEDLPKGASPDMRKRLDEALEREDEAIVEVAKEFLALVRAGKAHG